MPLYEYACPKLECLHRQEMITHVAGRFDAPDCHKCGETTTLAISAPAHPVMNPHNPVKRPKNM